MVNQFGLLFQCFVLFQHFSGNGQEKVGNGFYYFDGAEYFIGCQCFAYGLDVDKYDISQLFLGVIGNSYISYISFETNPFMFFRVLYIIRKNS